MKLKTLLVAFVALLSSLPAAAQQRAAAEVFHRITEAGVEVAIAIDVEGGWHLYGEDLGPADAIGTPTTIELSAIGLEFGSLRFPQPHRTEMPYGAEGLPTWAWTHSDLTVIYAFGAFEDGPLAADELDLFVELRGQTCSDLTGSCVLYEEDLESVLGGPDEYFADFPADMIPAKPLAALDKTKPFETEAYGDPFGDQGLERHAAAKLQHRIVGNTIEAVVSVTLDPHWHLYGETVGAPDAIGKPTTIALEAAGVTWEPLVFPAAEKDDQDVGLPDGPTWVWLYKNDFDVLARGTFEGAAPGEVRASIEGLTCSDETGQCVDFTQELKSEGVTRAAAFAGFANLVKDGGTAEPALGGAVEPDSARSLAPKKKSKGLWQFVLLCIGGGLFTLLMPCTYPMIPITISFFTKQAEKNGKPPIELSLAYGIGIILMFELIGFVVGPVIITFAQHWLTNAIIGGVFLYFALVLLGAVTLEPPRFLMKAAGGASQKGGLLGVFLMGATLVVTSFTCTAPILGSILTAGAAGGAAEADSTGVLRLALGMGAFGLTMAIPFVVLSLVPGKLSGLPSSGEWMNTLKVTLGFVELAAAFKFFSNWDMAKQSGVLPDELLLLVWIVTLGVATAYLFGFIKLTSSASDRISPVRALFGTGFLLLVGYFTLLLFGYPRNDVMTAFLPGYSNGSVFGAAALSSGDGEGGGEHASAHEIFVDDYDGALARAQSEGKLLLVNLTGFT